MVSHEPNRRQAKACERVEITCHDKGPVVRAEACQEDPYAALDVALDKLMERLRRQNDRRQVRRGRRSPESVASATARSWAAEPSVSPRPRSRHLMVVTASTTVPSRCGRRSTRRRR